MATGPICRAGGGSLLTLIAVLLVDVLVLQNLPGLKRALS